MNAFELDEEGKGVYNDLKKNCNHIKSPQRK